MWHCKLTNNQGSLTLTLLLIFGLFATVMLDGVIGTEMAPHASQHIEASAAEMLAFEPHRASDCVHAIVMMTFPMAAAPPYRGSMLDRMHQLGLVCSASIDAEPACPNYEGWTGENTHPCVRRAIRRRAGRAAALARLLDVPVLSLEADFVLFDVVVLSAVVKFAVANRTAYDVINLGSVGSSYEFKKQRGSTDAQEDSYRETRLLAPGFGLHAHALIYSPLNNMHAFFTATKASSWHWDDDFKHHLERTNSSRSFVSRPCIVQSNLRHFKEEVGRLPTENELPPANVTMPFWQLPAAAFGDDHVHHSP